MKLSPAQSVVIDSSYNGGFMTGRLVSIVLARVFRPRNIIVASCAACVAAAAFLCVLGPVDRFALYAGTGEGEGGGRDLAEIANHSLSPRKKFDMHHHPSPSPPVCTKSFYFFLPSSVFLCNSVSPLGTASLGFFIASQFGSGYSWVAQKMDITGRLSPVFFIGCGIGKAESKSTSNKKKS